MNNFRMTKYVLNKWSRIFFCFDVWQNVSNKLKLDQNNWSLFFESMNQNWFSLKNWSDSKIIFFHVEQFDWMLNQNTSAKTLENNKTKFVFFSKRCYILKTIHEYINVLIKNVTFHCENNFFFCLVVQIKKFDFFRRSWLVVWVLKIVYFDRRNEIWFIIKILFMSFQSGRHNVH